MHYATRRVKRFKRPLPSTWTLHHLPETGDNHVEALNGSNPLNNSTYDRHRRTLQPDALRGAVLLALVVVTVVLYVILWELERSSFVSVPNSSANQSVVTGLTVPLSDTSEAALTSHPLESGLLIFPSGENLNQAKELVAIPLSKAAQTTSNFGAWPPLITGIPEEHGSSGLAEKADGLAQHNEHTSLSSFDTAYCNGACRFLLPVRIAEQESKARVHFMQLLILAQRLNRTIVLPNVGKSRMNACSKWPFDTYYDTRQFDHGNNVLDSQLAVYLAGFALWVNQRPAPPTGLIISMKSLPQDGHELVPLLTRFESEDVPFIVGNGVVDPKISSCLESKFARLHSFPEMTLSISFLSSKLKTVGTSTRLVQLLSNNLDPENGSDFDLSTASAFYHASPYTNSSYQSLADIDVLVVDYDLRHPLFAPTAQPYLGLQYAPVLYDLADRLAENLGPFLGVHWRMESVPIQNLAWCAASLVSTLHARLLDGVTSKDVRHIWLATDYPRPLRGRPFSPDVERMSNKFGVVDGEDQHQLQNEGSLRKSSTFKTLSAEHDDAIEIFTDAFEPGGDLDTWTLTDIMEQLHRYPYIQGSFEVDDSLLGDPGMLGIVDKLVIVQAQAFVSGSRDCSKTSSFSKQVIEARQDLFQAQRGRGALHNVVEYFGQW